MTHHAITPEEALAKVNSLIKYLLHNDHQQLDEYLALIPIIEGAMIKEVPEGAIHNGRVFMERLENSYEFKNEHGYPLSSSYEWMEVKKCFEYIAAILAAKSKVVS